MSRWVVLVVVLLAAAGALVWFAGAPGTDDGEVEVGEREGSDTRAPDLKGPRLEGAGGNERAERTGAVVATLWAAPVVRSEPGGIVVRGRVIDVEGRGVVGGEVFASVPLVVVPQAGGAFEFRAGDEHAGHWWLAYRNGYEVSSTSLGTVTKPGTVTEGLELVALPARKVSLYVRHFEGPREPKALVEVQPMNRPKFTVPLDGQGQAEFGVPFDESVRITAQTPDGLYRAAIGVEAKPPRDSTTSIGLVLRGPWEPLQVFCRSSPDGAFTRRTARVVASWAQGPPTTCDVEVDGSSGSLLAPPALGQQLNVSAYVEREGEGSLEFLWTAAAAAKVLRNGLSISVTPWVPVTLRFVDVRGVPLPAFDALTTDPPLWRADLDGRVVLERRTSVPEALQTVIGLLSVGPLEPGTGDRVVSVPVSSRVSGRYSGPAIYLGSQLEPRVDAGGGRVFRGIADPERGTWVASLPLPAGTPVKVYVEALMKRFSETVEGRLGAEDLDLAAVATSLAVEVRHGRVVRPRGLVRIRPVNDDGTFGETWTSEVSPARPVSTMGPLKPGRYEIAFSTDRGGSWLVHAKHVDVGVEPVHLVLDFPPP